MPLSSLTAHCNKSGVVRNKPNRHEMTTTFFNKYKCFNISWSINEFFQYKKILWAPCVKMYKQNLITWLGERKTFFKDNLEKKIWIIIVLSVCVVVVLNMYGDKNVTQIKMILFLSSKSHSAFDDYPNVGDCHCVITFYCQYPKGVSWYLILWKNASSLNISKFQIWFWD